MNCFWGDGVNDTNVGFPLDGAPFSNASFKIFNVSHAYTKAGVFHQECTMFNMVSNQTLTNNVSRRCKVFFVDVQFEECFLVFSFSSWCETLWSARTNNEFCALGHANRRDIYLAFSPPCCQSVVPLQQVYRVL
jgi:hypothetical protein